MKKLEVILVVGLNSLAAFLHFYFHRSIGDLYTNFMVGFSAGMTASIFLHGPTKGETLDQFKLRKRDSLIYAAMTLAMIFGTHVAPGTVTDIVALFLCNAMMIRKFWSDAIS